MGCWDFGLKNGHHGAWRRKNPEDFPPRGVIPIFKPKIPGGRGGTPRPQRRFCKSSARSIPLFNSLVACPSKLYGVHSDPKTKRVFEVKQTASLRKVLNPRRPCDAPERRQPPGSTHWSAQYPLRQHTKAGHTNPSGGSLNFRARCPSRETCIFEIHRTVCSLTFQVRRRYHILNPSQMTKTSEMTNRYVPYEDVKFWYPSLGF